MHLAISLVHGVVSRLLLEEISVIFCGIGFDSGTLDVQSNAQSPRQPWHDLHCKIEGPAAYDVLTNFEQRWRKAAKWRDFKLRKVTPWHDEALIRVDRISWIISPSPGSDGDKIVRVCDEEDPENWHVQVGQNKSYKITSTPSIFLDESLYHCD